MKARISFVCQNCGAEAPRWIGKCPECGEWNTYVEEARTNERRAPAPVAGARGISAPRLLAEIDGSPEPRLQTGIGELDRVLGGGLVPGSVVLVGGDPGIGKSTLMMQMLVGAVGRRSLYVTGEESLDQVKLRTARLGLAASPELYVLAETGLPAILDAIERLSPAIVVVDSIQTMSHPDVESAPGSVAQVRECAAGLLAAAKTRGTAIVIVGHITKDGMIAGPKVLEHVVDAVLQFEGERTGAYRILRALKNRFGSTNEIGVFEMRDVGLREVANPSELFLSERNAGASGSVVVASVEGTRPLLVEVQSLVTSTSYSVPQRSVNGFDLRRAHMILAILEKHAGMRLGTMDVFINVAGGVRIDEPAADLGVALAVASSSRSAVVDARTVVIGELGLGGEVRAVSFAAQRAAEAVKLGFRTIILPTASAKSLDRRLDADVVGVRRIGEAIDVAVG